MRLWRKLPRTNNHPFTDECETRCRKVLRFLFEVEVFSEKTSFKNANFYFTTNFRRLPTRRWLRMIILPSSRRQFIIASSAFHFEVDGIQYVNLQCDSTLATIGFQVESIGKSPAKIIAITPAKIVCLSLRQCDGAWALKRPDWSAI